MSEDIPLLPQYAFMAWCLVKHRDNFTFTLSVPSTRLGPNVLLGAVFSNTLKKFWTE
jgi:hypothetical protein